ncbi:hypothetical protein BJY04DRAFT_230963 [Aspergillus karnatakaensis]|uniref:Zn(II)2Cys6 transcription factor n=1 Tax=Aspergillus karnatakaensis TaxID=1810916 RepID=UPI003CCCB07E
MLSPSKSFDCDFPGCSATYRRKEHLTRHQAQHLPQQTIECPICGRLFKRNDTLRRHVRQSHPTSDPVPPLRQACVNCRNSRTRCEGDPPCSRCRRLHIDCTFVNSPSSQTADSEPAPPSGGPDKIQHFLQLYFKNFHPHWPIIHRGTFKSSNEFPLLVQSMVVIGMWVNGAPNTRTAAISLHQTINTAIYEQRVRYLLLLLRSSQSDSVFMQDQWDMSIAGETITRDTPSWPMPLYQAILLHVIFSILLQGSTGVSLGLTLKPSLSGANIDLLASVVQGCRRLKIFHYPTMLAHYLPSEVIPYVWNMVEEAKRFGIALYRVCKLIEPCERDEPRQQLQARGEDTPRAPQGWQLTANELQFPLPSSDFLWNSTSETEWISGSVVELELIRSGDTLESEWISNSAELLRVVGM